MGRLRPCMASWRLALIYRGGALLMVEAKRASMPVSLPTDIVEELDAFMERYGKRLGYRGRSDFIAAAIRSQREHDEARALRLRALDETPDDAPLWTS